MEQILDGKPFRVRLGGPPVSITHQLYVDLIAQINQTNVPILGANFCGRGEESQSNLDLRVHSKHKIDGRMTTGDRKANHPRLIFTDDLDLIYMVLLDK